MRQGPKFKEDFAPNGGSISAKFDEEIRDDGASEFVADSMRSRLTRGRGENRAQVQFLVFPPDGADKCFGKHLGLRAFRGEAPPMILGSILRSATSDKDHSGPIAGLRLCCVHDGHLRRWNHKPPAPVGNILERRGTSMRKLIEQLANAEQDFIKTQFLAPQVRGGQVRVKLNGMVCTLSPEPRGFEGWGVFQADADFRAVLLREATKSQTAEYLSRFPTVRLILVRPLKGGSWLAYPANRGEFRQKFGEVKPVVVRLVSQARAFQHVVCRWDGQIFWFDKIDRSADPKAPGFMAKALKAFLAPDGLRFSGLTPELREAYSLVLNQFGELRVRCDETRLRRALEMGGGSLEGFVDRGDYWTTQWKTSDGEQYTSAIQKDNLTVMSSGICLDGEDAKFDLQSLVGVVEQAY